jgi:hypothetical protein
VAYFDVLSLHVPIVTEENKLKTLVSTTVTKEEI